MQQPRNGRSRFSLTAGCHNVIKVVMVVAFVPIVHNSGSHGEVQNLGLTPPNHGQSLGEKAGVIGQLSTFRPNRKGPVQLLTNRCRWEGLFTTGDLLTSPWRWGRGVSIHLRKDDPAGRLRKQTEAGDMTTGARMEDNGSEIAGVKLILGGGIQRHLHIVLVL